MKKFLLVVLALVAAASIWLVYALHSRPSADRYAALALPPSDNDVDGGLRVNFMGVSTLLLRDRTTSVLIDGFFTRPGIVRTALMHVSPDRDRINDALSRVGADRLDAVIPVHSHYDHAMDCGEVAKRMNAVVVGSASTANIARGSGLAEDRIVTVAGTQTLHFGDLTITLIPSKHFPHGKAMGDITAPLVPPVRATDYLEGGSFSVLVEREGRALLVQGSAGYVEGALAGRHADVVYLGVGLLGSKDEAYRDAYWHEVVSAVGAKRVIPVHWDDFTRSLEEPLVPLPWFLDNLDASMAFVTARAAAEGIDVRWPVLWRRTDPFAGM